MIKWLNILQRFEQYFIDGTFNNGPSLFSKLILPEDLDRIHPVIYALFLFLLNKIYYNTLKYASPKCPRPII